MPSLVVLATVGRAITESPLVVHGRKAAVGILPANGRAGAQQHLSHHPRTPRPTASLNITMTASSGKLAN